MFRIKFTEIKNCQKQLDKVSGLYCYHVNRNLKYVGISNNLWHRFEGGYLKECSTQHRNSKLMQLIETNQNDIEVIFKPINKELLKEEETKFIQDWIPLYNAKENPRYEIRPIQKVIGRFVNKENREVTFSEVREYLFHKWHSEVSYEKIDEALRDEKHNLGKYCSKKRGQEVLMPKRK
ncbi:hypothetical protein MHH66_20120 [Bacillus sp. FSL H8-0492]|uniref:hypothetical protein n=1 Tax=Bacillus sp. FSL H8-0492 TaxID=2921392 RepID=UPI0026A3F6F1